jgi:hypothetical protein
MVNRDCGVMLTMYGIGWPSLGSSGSRLCLTLSFHSVAIGKAGGVGMYFTEFFEGGKTISIHIVF